MLFLAKSIDFRTGILTVGKSPSIALLLSFITNSFGKSD